MNNRKSGIIMSAVLVLLCVILAVGVKAVFHACGAKEDGSYMSCHWAENVIFAMGIAMAVQCVIMIIFKSSSARAAVSAALLPQAVVTALIPGTVVRLCMMPEMHCRAVMSPVVIICACVIGIAALVNMFINLKGGRADA